MFEFKNSQSLILKFVQYVKIFFCNKWTKLIYFAVSMKWFLFTFQSLLTGLLDYLWSNSCTACKSKYCIKIIHNSKCTDQKFSSKPKGPLPFFKYKDVPFSYMYINFFCVVIFVFFLPENSNGTKGLEKP